MNEHFANGGEACAVRKGAWPRWPGHTFDRTATQLHEPGREDLPGVEPLNHSDPSGGRRRFDRPGAYATGRRPANCRAVGRRLRQFPGPLGGRSRAACHDADGEDALPDRRRGIRLLDEPGKSGDHHRSLLRGRRSRAELGKTLQKLNENLDLIPPGVSGWVVKPVEIDDVPVVTLTLAEKAQPTT